MIPIKRILLLIAISSILLSIVTGLLGQLQIAFFSGRIVIPQAITKIGLLGSLSLLLLYGKFQVRHNNFVILWWLFTIYLLVHSLVISGTSEFTLNSLFFSYNAYYFYFLLIPFYIMVEKNVTDKVLVQSLLLLFIPLSLLGIAQYEFRQPFVPTESVDGKFIVFSSVFFGSVRAFSLFTSGLEFGNFLGIMAPLTVILFLKNRGIKKAFWLLMFLLAIWAGYATLTRNIYISIAFASSAAIVINSSIKKNKKNLINWLPVLFGALSWSLTYAANYISNLFGSKQDVLSSLSVQMRLESWSYYSDLWLENGVVTALFGTGIVQNNRFEQFTSILIDNNFLSIGYHIGIIGLTLWILIMWKMWSVMLSRVIQDKTVLSIALTSFYATWISSGIYNINIYIYPLVFILVILSGKSVLNKQNLNDQQNGLAV